MINTRSLLVLTHPVHGLIFPRNVIWTLCSLAVHDLLVMKLGCATSRYEAWLAGALVRELLADPT
jgi:hypothetical protein